MVCMHTFQESIEKNGEVGYVYRLQPGIVGVEGLPSVRLFELVILENGSLGQVIGLSRESVDLMLFEKTPVKIGMKVARTNARVQIPVGEDLLGKMISPLGNQLNSIEPVKAVEYRSVDTRPGGIMSRAPITTPLETGVSIVDLVVPLARGQRELVIGDRKSGKTSFLLQTVTSQAKKGVLCIYASIGKRQSDIYHLQDHFQRVGISDKVVILAASSTDATGLQFLAPYSAMTIAEYFRDKGQDTLVIFDDLTAHANVYREINLLLRRFPGRSAYPGDIFYTHARLLERGGNFRIGEGSASISCLPVVQSVIGDLAAYITTNVMSMTDGHIFFDTQLFDQGRRPAVNPFLSVTRVGLQAQTGLMRDVSRQVSSFLVHYEQIKQYSHFGAEVSQEVRDSIRLGEQLLTFFQQLPDQIVPMNLTIFVVAILWSRIWTDGDTAALKTTLASILSRYEKEAAFSQVINTLVSQAKTFTELMINAKAQAESLGIRYLQTSKNGEASHG